MRSMFFSAFAFPLPFGCFDVVVVLFVCSAESFVGKQVNAKRFFADQKASKKNSRNLMKNDIRLKRL